MDAFEQIARPLAEDHRRQIAAALSSFAAATDDVQAWPHWRALERGWMYLSAPDRRAMKALAQRLLNNAPDSDRRQAIIDRLED